MIVSHPERYMQMLVSMAKRSARQKRQDQERIDALPAGKWFTLGIASEKWFVTTKTAGAILSNMRAAGLVMRVRKGIWSRRWKQA
jgi:hypothetical protein